MPSTQQETKFLLALLQDFGFSPATTSMCMACSRILRCRVKSLRFPRLNGMVSCTYSVRLHPVDSPIWNSWTLGRMIPIAMGCQMDGNLSMVWTLQTRGMHCLMETSMDFASMKAVNWTVGGPISKSTATLREQTRDTTQLCPIKAIRIWMD